MSDPDEVNARDALPAPVDNANRSAQLQAALDLIDEGFTLIDQDLRLLAWNASFL